MEWNKILNHQENDPEWKIDLCIDCSGNANAIQAALPLLEYGSTLLIFGVADPSKTIRLVLNWMSLKSTSDSIHLNCHFF